jgi:class 3 adenylate cyclase
VICPNCATENLPGAKFCNECGTRLSAACPNCGATNAPGAKFCNECGTRLGDGPSSAAPAARTSSIPVQGPAAATERRLVSVLFADLVGFTALAADRDSEAVRELLTRYFEQARETVERYGGTVEKFIGDAVMAVWGTPVAQEDDAERAVRTALDLIESVRALDPGADGRGLEARAGVLTGEATVTLGATNQGMVAGDLVNTASRLQSVAPPNTVLVGEATQRATSRAIAYEEAGEQLLRGKQAPVRAWRALRVVAKRGGEGRAEGLEAPFVGRDDELRLLRDFFHATSRERRARLISITGQGGIGKSRLAWEFQKYLDGVLELVYWHQGRSPAYGEGITFWALGEMVRRRAGLVEGADEATSRERIAATLEEFVPDAGERRMLEGPLLFLLGFGEAPAGGRDDLFAAWRTFIERIADRATTVLVFEDLQWADPGLLDFIDHLLEWSAAYPIYVVTLARPELLERRPDWGAGRRNFIAISLQPLAEPAMRQLLVGLVPGLPETALRAILDRADGVPLYAVETVRMLVAQGRLTREGDRYVPQGDLAALDVPESLHALIAARLDALDTADR